MLRKVECKRWHIDLAGVVLTITLTAGVYFAALRPMLRHRTSLAETNRRLLVQRRKCADLRECELAAQKQLASVRRELAQSGIQLRPTNYVNRQVAVITELINSSGLAVDDIQLGTPRSGSWHDSVPILLAGRGGYSQCAIFLNRVSSILPDTGVSSFQLSGEPAGPKDNETFKFALLWHTLPARNGG